MKTAVLCVDKSALEQALLDPRDSLGTTGIYKVDLSNIPADRFHFINRRIVDDVEVGLSSTIGRALPQLLAYTVLKDMDGNYLSYSRGNTGGETRLANQRSIGVGGHTDIDDLAINAEGFIDPLKTVSMAMIRELTEEAGATVALASIKAGAYLGNQILVNAEDAASQVHVGILTELTVERDWVEKSNELKDVQWLSKESLQFNINQYEPWSKLVIESM